MLKRYSKSIFCGLIIITIFFNFLIYSLPIQAGSGAQTELYKQMNAAGDKAWGNEPTMGSSGLADIIQYAISAFLGLLGIILIVLIIYAGFNWMTARGDEEKVSLAKNTLTRAMIGLIIILAAYSITYFVFTSLSRAGGPGSPGGG